MARLRFKLMDNGERVVRRLVMAFAITQIIAWGSLYYSIAVLGTTIAADLGLSRAGLFAIVSATLMVLGSAAPTVGRLIDATGGRMVMCAGSLLGALACATLALAPNVWVYALGWAIGGISMAMGLYDPAFATLNRHTGVHYRRALTMVTLAGGFASTVFWPLTMQLLNAIGWRGAFGVFALLHLFVCLPLHWLAIPAGGGEAGASAAPGTSAEPSPSASPSAAASSAPLPAASIPVPAPVVASATTPVEAGTGAQPQTRVLLTWLTLSFAIAVFIGSTMSVHLLGLLQATGMTLAAAVIVGAVIGPMQVAGRLGEFLLGARVRPQSVGAAAVLLLAAAMAALTQVDGSLRAGIGFAMLYGMGNGLMTIARGMVPAVLFGRSGYGARIGRIARWVFFANAVAPATYAALLGIGIGYRNSVLALLALALLGVFAYRRAMALARALPPPPV